MLLYSRENSSKMCHIDKYAHPRRRDVASFAVNGQYVFSNLNFEGAFCDLRHPRSKKLNTPTRFWPSDAGYARYFARIKHLCREFNFVIADSF